MPINRLEPKTAADRCRFPQTTYTLNVVCGSLWRPMVERGLRQCNSVNGHFVVNIVVLNIVFSCFLYFLRVLLFWCCTYTFQCGLRQSADTGLTELHRGCHTKIFGWAKSLPPPVPFFPLYLFFHFSRFPPSPIEVGPLNRGRSLGAL